MRPRPQAEASAHLLLVHVENAAAAPRAAEPAAADHRAQRAGRGDTGGQHRVAPALPARAAGRQHRAAPTSVPPTARSSTASASAGRCALEDGARITIGAHALNYHRRSQQELAGWEALDRELGEASDYVLSVLPPPIADGTGAGRVVLSAMHAAGRRCVRLSDARFPLLRRLHAGRRRATAQDPRCSP